jgi:thiol-disulfide isomerase/thioredoxin
MKKYNLILIILFLIPYLSFSQETIEKEILLGDIVKKDFQKAPFNKWFNKEYDNYQLDSTTLNKIKKAYSGENVLIYFGSWCSDSRREVPRFLKMIDYLNIDYKKVDITGLDSNKSAPNYKKNIWDIQYVPTFIFLQKNKKEIGRIIEIPNESLEQDLLNILMKNN